MVHPAVLQLHLGADVVAAGERPHVHPAERPERTVDPRRQFLDPVERTSSP